MAEQFRTTNQVLQEKLEDRGWKEENMKLREQIKPLPLTEEEYRSFSILLAKMALYDKDPNLCEMYFDMQRRASYGNRYPLMEEMAEIEKNMWSLGTGETIENERKYL